MTQKPKRPALGRGLGALIPEPPRPAAPPPAPLPPGTPADRSGTPRELPIEAIEPNPEQPRKHFDPTRLQELADSIKTQGIIQPIVVTTIPDRGPDMPRHRILAGERRWRAAQLAGLHSVPVVVRDTPEAERLELALVENLQRQDLNPLEEAEAYQRLTTQHGYTQEQIAERVGKERATVANALRLLKLPPGVRQRMVAGELQMGHARALLGLEEAPAIERAAATVVKRQLSVRQTEELVRKERGGKPTQKTAPVAPQPSPAVRDLQARLERTLGTKVRIAQRDNKSGTVQIDYHSLDQLDGLLGRILR